MSKEKKILLTVLVVVGGYLIFLAGYMAGQNKQKGASSTVTAGSGVEAIAVAPAANDPGSAAQAPAAVPQAAPAPETMVSEPPPPPPPPRPTAPAGNQQPPAPPADPNQVWRVQIHDDDAKVGPDNAAVKVVIFGSYGNQESVDFASAVDNIVKDYGDKVQVRYKHKVVPAPHPEAVFAAEIACAANAQGKFWPLHNKLMSSVAISAFSVEQAAKEVGVDWNKAKAEVDATRYRTQVYRDSLLATEVAANTYPNALVNGVRLSNPKTYERLKPIIDEQLKKAAELAKSSGKGGNDLYNEMVKGGKFFEQMGGPKANFQIAQSPMLGKPDAKIQVVTFEDFECPFCSTVGPNLKEFQARYPNDVVVVYKHLPLDIHPAAQLAAEASMAALQQGQDKFWTYHDILFKNQKALDKDSLIRYAGEAGLDVEKFKQDLDAGVGKAIITRDVQEAARAGASGTPSVYVNGMKYQGPRGYPADGLDAVSRTYFGL